MSRFGPLTLEALIAARLRDDAPTLGELLAKSVERNIDEYAELQLQGEGLYLRESFTRLVLWFVANLEAHEPHEPHIDEAFIAQTRQRAYEGLPLESILHAWRIVGHELWLWLQAQKNHLASKGTVAPDEPDISAIWSQYLRFADIAIESSTRAYKDARDKAELSTQMIASATLERLLVEEQESEVAAALARLGVSTSPIAVLACWIEGDGTDGAASGAAFVPLLSVITTSAGVRPPWVIHGRTLVSVVEVSQNLKRRLGAVADQHARMRIGLGVATLLKSRLSNGLRQANIALSNASARRQVVFAEELSVFELVASQSPIITADLPAWVNAYLVEDAKRSFTWSDTVQALLAHAGSVSDAADALFIHSNTVYYRLSAMRASGFDMSNPETLVAARFASMLKEREAFDGT